MRTALLTVVALLPGCAVFESVPNTVETYQQENPPPELGRPGWVRTSAGVGGWIGGVAGAAVSVVLLPITYPVRLIRGDGGTFNNEDLFFPVTWGVTGGHFLLGAPTDVVDFVFRRAWVGSPVEYDNYELVPQDPPIGPSEQLPPKTTETPPVIRDN